LIKHKTKKNHGLDQKKLITGIIFPDEGRAPEAHRMQKKQQ
jgi:hypothetical protein